MDAGEAARKIGGGDCPGFTFLKIFLLFELNSWERRKKALHFLSDVRYNKETVCMIDPSIMQMKAIQIDSPPRAAQSRIGEGVNT